MNRLVAAMRLILTLNCEHSTRLVSESLDRDLGLVERWAVRMHFLGCWSCRRFGRQVRQLRDAFRLHRRDAESQGLTAEAVQRIEEAIRKESV